MTDITDIYVSDLFGYNITNSTPIIIINTNEPYKLLRRLDKDSSISPNTSIWEYNLKKISDVLKERNVDIDNFLMLGHVLYKSNLNPKILILGNINLCGRPNKYEEVATYGSGKIVRPYLENADGIKTYTLGLFYSKDSEFDVSQIGVIPSELLMDISKTNNAQTGNSKTSDLDTNEFSLLSSTKLGLKTIRRSKILNGETRKIKLMTPSQKYLTVIDSDVKIKNSQQSLSQTFSYNAQGELTTDGKCLTYNDASVSAEECDSEHSNKRQKWLLSQNKILPSNDFEKCLETPTSNNGKVYLKQCDDTSLNQSWSTESSDSDVSENSSTDYNWDKYHGKTVVLVENDNPWFVNDDVVTKKTYNTAGAVLHDDIVYRENADYKSNFVMDINSPSMGYGYSFADKGGIPCDKIEGFGQINSKSCSGDMQIIAIIILIAVILMLYKMFKSGYFN